MEGGSLNPWSMSQPSVPRNRRCSLSLKAARPRYRQFLRYNPTECPGLSDCHLSLADCNASRSPVTPAKPRGDLEKQWSRLLLAPCLLPSS